jgi:hypothetical protein
MGTLWNVEGTTGSLTKGNFYKPNVITTSGTINAVDGNEYIIESGATPTIQLPNIAQLYERIRITIINSPSTVIVAGGSDAIRLDNNETASGGTLTNTVLGQCIELLALVNQSGSGFAWVAVNFTNQWFLNTGILACPQNTLNANNNTLSVNFKVRQLIANNGVTVNLDWSTPSVVDFNNSDIINVHSIAPAIPSPPKFTVISSTSATMVVNNGYAANNSSLVTLTLPATAAVGSEIRVTGLGTGGWQIAQNSGQLINFGSSTTTTGMGGSLSSTDQFDSIYLICVVANTTWNVMSSIGNIILV